MSDRIFLERMATVTLAQLRWCLDENRYSIEDRAKNRAFLAENGFTLEDQLDILRSLTPRDCFKAEEDRDDPKGGDTYWFYKRKYEGLPVYVKYKIVIKKIAEREGDFAFIKSIHEDGY